MQSEGNGCMGQRSTYIHPWQVQRGSGWNQKLTTSPDNKYNNSNTLSKVLGEMEQVIC